MQKQNEKVTSLKKYCITYTAACGALGLAFGLLANVSACKTAELVGTFAVIGFSLGIIYHTLAKKLRER